MKKTILALALWLLAAGASAQSYLCGSTGFNSNIGSAAKSFRCAPKQITRGVGTLTFNATSTVTVSPAGFQALVAPEAVPGGDGAFFRVGGLMVTFAGEVYFLNITAKASDSSITALLGSVGPSFSGTTTTWSFWNTDCYRTANASSNYTTGDTAVNLSQRIWATSHLMRELDSNAGVSSVYRARGLIYSAAAGSGSAMALSTRPAGLPTQFYTTGVTGWSFGGAGTTARHLVVASLIPSVPVAGAEFQFSMDSATANTFITGCIVTSP